MKSNPRNFEDLRTNRPAAPRSEFETVAKRQGFWGDIDPRWSPAPSVARCARSRQEGTWYTIQTPASNARRGGLRHCARFFATPMRCEYRARVTPCNGRRERAETIRLYTGGMGDLAQGSGGALSSLPCAMYGAAQPVGTVPHCSIVLCAMLRSAVLGRRLHARVGRADRGSPGGGSLAPSRAARCAAGAPAVSTLRELNTP